MKVWVKLIDKKTREVEYNFEHCVRSDFSIS